MPNDVLAINKKWNASSALDAVKFFLHNKFHLSLDEPMQLTIYRYSPLHPAHLSISVRLYL